MSSLAPGSEFGQRLLPSYVDEIAHADPSRILYSITKTKDPADGFQDINASVFARAVNRCAWYLEEKLGKGQNNENILYMGPQDIVYGIVILASLKVGYTALLSSPRNTLEAHLSLLEKTDCNTFLLPPVFPLPVVKQIQGARPMRVLEIATAPHWLDDLPSASEADEPAYPFTKTYAEARHEPWVTLHTSGSTGVPKAIAQRHATYAPIESYQRIPEHLGGPAYPSSCKGRRMYLGLPLFHCAGASIMLPCAILIGFTIVLGPFPPSAEVVDAMHRYGNIQESAHAPTVLIELAKDPAAVERVGKLDLLIYGGGPMPPRVGKVLAAKTRLHSALGGTEAGVIPGVVVVDDDPADWQYTGISPALGAEYRHVSGDLYEQVIVRKKELEPWQAIFGTFPELNEYYMKDLYSPHPTRKDAWLYRGRSDDIIVFSTGEKLNPIEMENMIQAQPEVSAAIISGMGRFQTSLLVEPAKPVTTEDERHQLLDAIWLSVQAANKESPSHGRIHRDMIIFTSPEKPMLRAGKGTVQRQLTLGLYSDELDELYKRVENATAVENPSDGDDSSVGETVRSILGSSTDLQLDGLDKNANLFELGVDSLQVSVIARKLNKYLAKLEKPVTLEPRAIYSNPSIASLVNAVTTIVEGTEAVSDVRESSEDTMQRLYDCYTVDLPISARQPIAPPTDQLVIVLTGSTGSLGSYILDTLATNKKVSKVYCLNRGPESFERQQKSQAAKGLAPLAKDKVVCLDADLSKSRFGLSADEYKSLLHDTTDIIHNAWQVDFNLSVESFTSQIASVRRLVDFSVHARFGPGIFFVSSISAVGNWSATKPASGENGTQPQQVPAQIFHDWSVSESTGYGQSKLLAENILDAAASQASVPAVICRVGQVAGPTTGEGIWPKQEWLPSLIASSKHLGVLPDSLGPLETVDWVPVDKLSRVIVELAVDHPPRRDGEGGAEVFHAVNPRHSTWASLVPTVAKSLGVKPLPLREWIMALKESEGKDVDLAAHPAIKIKDFYEGLIGGREHIVSLDTSGSVATSATLAGLQPIQTEMVENWLTQWAF